MPEIELEWNPFSAASRAARAARAGRVAEALRLYAKAGQRNRIRECLRNAIRERDLQELFVKAADEIIYLGRGIPGVRTGGMAQAVAAKLKGETEHAAVVLWRSAERVAAATSHGVESPGLQHALGEEKRKLETLILGVREVRRRLAELTMNEDAESDLGFALLGFQALAQATQELGYEIDAKAN